MTSESQIPAAPGGAMGAAGPRLAGNPPAGAGKVAGGPVADVTKVLIVGEIAAAAAAAVVALARAAASRAPASRTQISMGPGGWVSMRGGDVRRRTFRLRGRVPRRRRPAPPPARRPWWAVLLGAVPLTRTRSPHRR
jgi:hypothetical protein